MKTIQALLMAGLLAALATVAGQRDVAAQDDNVQRFPMNPYHVNIGRIAEVAPDGTLQVRDVANPRFALQRRTSGQPDLTEGLYLGLVAREFVVSTADTRLLRVQVTRVLDKGAAVLRVAPQAAANVKPGESIVFFRPPGSTTDQLRAVPDFAPVDDGGESSVLGQQAVNLEASRISSQNNLKEIALALHNYHDVYKGFPPAVVYGPDGEPWHSWRVLILPFLEQSMLFNRYRFDEPWNGPRNRQLLSQIPSQYRDPVYGNSDDAFTHYTAITGEHAVFTATGAKMRDKNDNQLQHWRGRAFREILDGTANTLMIGQVSPDRKIPWMKPEDVVVDDKFPGLGKPGGFAAPYLMKGEPATLFAFCDGSVRTLPGDLDPQTLQNLLAIADGNAIDDLPDGAQGRQKTGVRQAQVIEITHTDDGPRARLVWQ